MRVLRVVWGLRVGTLCAIPAALPAPKALHSSVRAACCLLVPCEPLFSARCVRAMGCAPAYALGRVRCDWLSSSACADAHQSSVCALSHTALKNQACSGSGRGQPACRLRACADLVFVHGGRHQHVFCCRRADLGSICQCSQCACVLAW